MSTIEPKQTVVRTWVFQWLLPPFWILIGSGFYIGATRISTAVVQDKHDPGPAAICMLCSAALILLGITQGVQLLITRSNIASSKPTSDLDVSHQSTKPTNPALALLQSILGVYAIAIYIFAVFQIGFGLATLVFGIVSMKSLGASWLATLLATATCIATVYLVFIELLGILLPTGRWDLPF
ncbi:MAG: tripartite tricarboxylate transporter TctB family protein [Dehalococcoidia bacterium]|nr:tripartite tricarboxylate transporter TctB family protein [Dehalococcoidia bacterium]